MLPRCIFTASGNLLDRHSHLLRNPLLIRLNFLVIFGRLNSWDWIWIPCGHMNRSHTNIITVTSIVTHKFSFSIGFAPYNSPLKYHLPESLRNYSAYKFHKLLLIAPLTCCAMKTVPQSHNLLHKLLLVFSSISCVYKEIKINNGKSFRSSILDAVRAFLLENRIKFIVNRLAWARGFLHRILIHTQIFL